MTIRILTGDCRDVLKTLGDNSVDAIVTDPPYHLTTGKKGGSGEASASLATPHGRARVTTGFMGVLKPGGYLAAFGGTRTYRRLVCAIEDAGFEVRDMLAWLYGSGFPKGTDKAKIPEQWRGWNTALKPAIEPICLARKPMVGTLAENVQRYGTGALWIDGCRVALDGERPVMVRTSTVVAARAMAGESTGATASGETTDTGRWPANLIHDGSEEVVEAFPESTSGHWPTARGAGGISTSGHGGQQGLDGRQASSGSAARFFYCAKADRADRNDGGAQNHHPTVKPTDLMRYLCRLVTPPGGLVLDPFMGSGSTLKAAELEGLRAIGIELSPEYVAIARRRIGADAPLFTQIEESGD